MRPDFDWTPLPRGGGRAPAPRRRGRNANSGHPGGGSGHTGGAGRDFEWHPTPLRRAPSGGGGGGGGGGGSWLARARDAVVNSTPIIGGIKQGFDLLPESDIHDLPESARPEPEPLPDWLKGGIFDPDATPEAKAERAADFRLDERKEREQALNFSQGPKPTSRPKQRGQVDRMSWEEYNALSDKQRAAVDFNTMLVSAVRKDRKNQDDYDPSKEQQHIYDLSVEKMFGDDRGSDMYAPETLSVLKQIKYTDSNADLDDFLGLRAAITAKDLKHIGTSTAPGAVSQSGAGDVQIDRMNLSQELADRTQKLEQSLTKGRQLLQSMNATAAVERNFDLRGLGGLPNEAPPSLGFGQGEVDVYFQQAFDALANKANTKDAGEIIDVVQSELSPDEFQAFQTFSDTRSGNAARYGDQLGTDPKVTYRSPQEFRDLFVDNGGQ